MERVFSRGRILLSHIRNRMTATTTRAAMCLGIWSELDLIDAGDLKVVAAMPEVEDGENNGDGVF